jgi:hypothetical protein
MSYWVSCKSKTGRKAESMRHLLMRRVALLVLGLLASSLTAGWAQDCAGPEPGPCSLLDRAKAVFVGTVSEADYKKLRFRFHVSEAFRGVKGDYIDLTELRPDRSFELGKQYLVFARPCNWGTMGSGCLAAMTCSGTLPLEYATALVEQLRAEKSGKPVAAVYGTLVRDLREGEGIWVEGYRRPLPNIVIRLKSNERSFETRTDEYGVYAFPRLPEGKYQVSADLPPNLELQELMGGQSPPFELPRRSCFDNDLYALPTGLITGRVIGPDGKPLRHALVDLYQASRYKQRMPGSYSLQEHGMSIEEWNYFRFNDLPADDYVLVFNPANQEDPDAPFPRTFYPQASDLASSQIIHLAEGQQLLNADIHVNNPLPTRQITLRIEWNGGRPQDSGTPHMIVKASGGAEPCPIENGRDTYTLNLLLGAQYAIRAEAYCKLGKAELAKTGAVTVDGSDLSVSEVKLTFDQGACRSDGPMR